MLIQYTAASKPLTITIKSNCTDTDRVEDNRKMDVAYDILMLLKNDIYMIQNNEVHITRTHV